MNPFTGLSFIIAHRTSDNIELVVKTITASVSPEIPFEVISTMGNHPTYQRNKAAVEARYSHLYFLDNDSIVNKKSLDTLVDILKNKEKIPMFSKKISLIGGPSLLLQPASYFEECVQEIFSTSVVIGKVKSRYNQVGIPRFSNDQEMILCNLIINKSAFEKLNQFDTNLYPNEENDFIYRLLFAQKQKKDLQILGQVLHHPQIFVHRPQRKNYLEFIRQMLNYGRGRAEQTKNNFKTLHWHLLFAMGFFFIFVIFLLNLSFNQHIIFQNLNVTKIIKTILTDGFLLYFLYTLLIFIKKSSQRKKFLIHIPILIFCCHFFYGLGMFLGFLKKKFKASDKKVFCKINKVH